MFTFFFLSDSRRRRRHAPSRGPTSTCARAELNAAQEERVGEEEEVAVPTTAGTNVWLAIRFSCDPLFLSLIPRKPSFRSFGGFGGGDRETKRSLSLSLSPSLRVCLSGNGSKGKRGKSDCMRRRRRRRPTFAGRSIVGRK